jgi:hypothetical protein
MMDRETAIQNAQSQSLLTQDLQFDKTFQSKKVSLSSSASSLGVGLGVLEIRCGLPSGLLNVLDELL